MKWLAAALNFFLPGLGYIVAGQKRLLGICWLLGAFGLTYVEMSLQEPMPDKWLVMFISVFVMNTAFAIDAYRSVKDKDAAKAELPLAQPA